MTIEEMAKKVGPVTLALLSAKAQSLANSYNRSPDVDQGGQYVFTDARTELFFLLEKEVELAEIKRLERKCKYPDNDHISDFTH